MRRFMWISFILTAALCGCREQVDIKTIRLGSDGYISWEDAKRVLLHSDSKGVTQTHSLHVMISMKDGTEYRTKEPKIDEVRHFIKANGLTERIRYATE